MCKLGAAAAEALIGTCPEKLDMRIIMARAAWEYLNSVIALFEH